MILIAHFFAITCYIGAAALAAAPFARPVSAPVRGVIGVLGLGVLAHLVALAAATRAMGQLPLSGLGPALSFAGLTLAVVLLLIEVLAREVTLTLVAAPLAAICVVAATIVGLRPIEAPTGMPGVWLDAHIALSFAGIAAFATAAAAGTMYLVERRELKSRRFGAIFRFFPPLQTLDRVNHLSALAGMVLLTVGVVLAGTYAIAYHAVDMPKIVWALGAWLGVSAVAVGRLVGGWQAQRAALISSVTFTVVVLVYVVVRAAAPAGGKFL